jgi:hypothetical protein
MRRLIEEVEKKMKEKAAAEEHKKKKNLKISVTTSVLPKPKVLK